MKVSYLFGLIEKQNELKQLIGEKVKTKVVVSRDGNVIGVAHNLRQFYDVVGDELREIMMLAEVQKTSSLREFKIVFENDKFKYIKVEESIKLFVE